MYFFTSLCYPGYQQLSRSNCSVLSNLWWPHWPWTPLNSCWCLSVSITAVEDSLILNNSPLVKELFATRIWAFISLAEGLLLMLRKCISYFTVGSTICYLANWFMFHDGIGPLQRRGSIVGCSNVEWTNWSRRDSATAVVLRKNAKVASTWPMSHSSCLAQLRWLSASALVFCFPAQYLKLKQKLATSGTHHCSTALSLFFGCRLVKGLLSVNTIKVKDSGHLRARSSHFLEEYFFMFLSAPRRARSDLNVLLLG